MVGSVARCLAWIWAACASLYGVAWLIDGAWAGISLLVSGLLSIPLEKIGARSHPLGLATWHRISIAACCAIVGILLIHSMHREARSRVCVNTLTVAPGEGTYSSVHDTCEDEAAEEAGNRF